MALYQSGTFTKARVEAFSDGVFAIIVTLLVFELRFPHLDEPDNVAVWQGIVGVLPKLLSWVNSFLVVCVIWMNHHRVIGMFQSIDTGIFWFNNILLMVTSLIPFPTAIIGDYPQTEVAVCFYGICLALPALAFSLLRVYVVCHPSLLATTVNLQIFRRGIWLSLIYGPVFYLTGAAFSWVSITLAFAIYLFVPLYFIFPKAVKAN